jgi:hypothetical protein
MMKKLSFVTLACVLLFSACKKDNDDPGPNPSKSRMMFVHTSLDPTDSVKVVLNSTPITTPSRIGYLGYTPYLEVNPGSTKIEFRIGNTNSLLKDTTVTLSANLNYSAFATGALNNRRVVLVTDDLTAPVQGKAKVRFVNLSPSMLNLKAEIGDSTYATNLGYGMATPFVEVAADSYDIVMGDAVSALSTVKSLIAQPLAASKIYTIMYTGVQGGGGNTGLKLSIVNNN